MLGECGNVVAEYDAGDEVEEEWVSESLRGTRGEGKAGLGGFWCLYLYEYGYRFR